MGGSGCSREVVGKPQETRASGPGQKSPNAQQCPSKKNPSISAEEKDEKAQKNLTFGDLMARMSGQQTSSAASSKSRKRAAQRQRGNKNDTHVEQDGSTQAATTETTSKCT